MSLDDLPNLFLRIAKEDSFRSEFNDLWFGDIIHNWEATQFLSQAF